jgi:hypothetical protein
MRRSVRVHRTHDLRRIRSTFGLLRLLRVLVDLMRVPCRRIRETKLFASDVAFAALGWWLRGCALCIVSIPLSRHVQATLAYLLLVALLIIERLLAPAQILLQTRVYASLGPALVVGLTLAARVLRAWRVRRDLTLVPVGTLAGLLRLGLLGRRSRASILTLTLRTRCLAGS